MRRDVPRPDWSRPLRALCALAIATGTAIALPGAAVAASPDAGLFGAADPTFDGVFRQSVALLGLRAVDAPAPAPAVQWLAAQQCLDGSFEAYRVSIRTICRPPDPENFTGPDSNSTALAAMALRAQGQPGNAQRAIGALMASQNADGGWGYILGSSSEANSTGLVLSALYGAQGQGVRQARSRARAYLATQQVDCSKTGDFGLTFPPSKTANALASAQALIGIAGTDLPFAPPAAYGSLAGTTCASAMKAKVAAYVSDLLMRTRGRIPSPMDPADVDWNATASAVIGLGAASLGRNGVQAGLQALQANVAASTVSRGNVAPASVGALLIVADITGKDPRRFGTPATDLVRALLSSMRR
ncbi:MAG: terpene cyclase/mutase family protein [Actinomycetales bacterium]|nr:terpene cyclase/mutase family protein [Actinomycetales bacterium]